MPISTSSSQKRLGSFLSIDDLERWDNFPAFQPSWKFPPGAVERMRSTENSFGRGEREN